MKDIFLPIRQAYYTALQGNITLNSQVVNVYDVVPMDAQYPYVVFAQQQSTVTNLKRGCEAYQATILLEIVTKYAAYKGGRKDADTIADQIYSLLNPPLPQTDGMQIGLTYPDTDFDQGREMTQTHTINRRFMQFKNAVSLF